eukprot:CAMPEP_0172711536 /NCGR_PEP_ID=MMETSP1074-20121228/59453_1 /TAXON_ID=2916 /ORGANISM="Ceratium fusus, Strain PA161109" /LENGTH=359 /DNA_ID=CAMNT_0013535253 /DNA_START=54 /DNA_END=1134 /DNA_ORIENTATION=+
MNWGSAGGKDVHCHTLKSPCLEVDVISLGAALTAVRVLVDGSWIDVLMAYDTLEKYPAKGEPERNGKPNFSTVVGRCANRVADGRFELDGKSFELNKNIGQLHLHGGVDGFYSQVWDVVNVAENAVTLRLSEPDGAMGYPGKVDVDVTYEILENELHFKYRGVTDQPTLLSMTNHGYWNLKGHAAGNVLDHTLMVRASHTTAVDDKQVMTGELLPVESTGLDFRTPHLLQAVFDKVGPVDTNYCLDKHASSEVLAARLEAPNGIAMEVWTDQPGLQVFTGGNIDPGTASSGMAKALNGRSLEQFALSLSFGLMAFTIKASQAQFCDQERCTGTTHGTNSLWDPSEAVVSSGGSNGRNLE